jgi:hypothetical protein
MQNNNNNKAEDRSIFCHRKLKILHKLDVQGALVLIIILIIVKPMKKKIHNSIKMD